MMASYTSNTSLMTKIREVQRIRQWHVEQAHARVRQTMADLEELAAMLQARYDLTLRDLDILDIGTGQQQLQSVWFARHNRVVGIDLDVVPKGWSPRPYLRMWRANGANRVLKTLARKALGLDRKYHRALSRELGRTAEDLPVLQMDVTAMALPSDSFDFVYCATVLQCVPDVDVALREMNRVLRPGAVGYFTVHLYTSENGSLDPRLYSGDRSGIPYWAHLRPAHAHRVSGNAWLNKLRLAEWRQRIEANLPNPIIELHQPNAATLRPTALALQQQGELADYTMDELLTHGFSVSWRKDNEVNASVGQAPQARSVP